MTDPFEAIRAHVEAHADKERAMFSVAGVKALLAEMDRRPPLGLSGSDRRQWFISDRLAKNGHFNRSDIREAFGISHPQASIDIRHWLEANPGGAFYNKSRKRYEVGNG